MCVSTNVYGIMHMCIRTGVFIGERYTMHSYICITWMRILHTLQNMEIIVSNWDIAKWIFSDQWGSGHFVSDVREAEETRKTRDETRDLQEKNFIMQSNFNKNLKCLLFQVLPYAISKTFWVTEGLITCEDGTHLETPDTPRVYAHPDKMGLWVRNGRVVLLTGTDIPNITRKREGE